MNAHEQICSSHKDYKERQCVKVMKYPHSVWIPISSSVPYCNLMESWN